MITYLKVEAVAGPDGKALVTARFLDFGKPAQILWTLVPAANAPSGWRVGHLRPRAERLGRLRHAQPAQPVVEIASEIPPPGGRRRTSPPCRRRRRTPVCRP